MYSPGRSFERREAACMLPVSGRQLSLKRRTFGGSRKNILDARRMGDDPPSLVVVQCETLIPSAADDRPDGADMSVMDDGVPVLRDCGSPPGGTQDESW